jgi:hypothetical protein
MKTMGDLLDRAMAFSQGSCTEEAASRLFGWDVREIAAVHPEPDKSTIVVAFANGIIMEISYYHNLDLAGIGETAELTLALRTDLISKVAYNLFYSGYIHGQGYIRLAVAKADNPVAKTIIEDVYIPGLKAIYRPIISQFQGFRTRDFFGTMASSVGGQIYYSGITSRSDNKDVLVSDVVGRLYALDDLLKEPEIRHALAELDLQVSFLPSTVWG